MILLLIKNRQKKFKVFFFFLRNAAFVSFSLLTPITTTTIPFYTNLPISLLRFFPHPYPTEGIFLSSLFIHHSASVMVVSFFHRFSILQLRSVFYCSRRLSQELDFRVAYFTMRLKSDSGDGVRHLVLGDEGGGCRVSGGGQSRSRICDSVPTNRSSTWSFRAADVSVYLLSKVDATSRASETRR